MTLSDIISSYTETAEVLTYLSQWYKHCLEDTPVVYEYALTERQLSLATIEHFCLGHAPETSKTLDFLKTNSLDTAPLISTGNFHVTSGITFDKFEGRLIFPIFDFLGNVIGFSGRTIPPEDETIRKYVNSPTSLVYKKSLSLYGLYQAYAKIQEYDFAVIVEGNIDVCMSHQEGVGNVIAPCGTALRQEHLLLLKHFTNNMVCIFDNDVAGKNAATKARQLCKDADCNFYSIVLEGVKDPDEFLKKYGGREFINVIDEALKET